MRDANTETDSRAHRGFAFLDDGDDGIAVFRLDSTMLDEQIDQLLNSLPAISSLEFCNDLFLGEKISQLHGMRPTRNPGSD